MERDIITVYCLIDEYLKLSGIKDDVRAEIRVQIKICTKADTDSLIGLNFSFPSPAGALSA